ncbi:hypothetical protein JCM11641_005245 [Rhodosporidiobolus odoratus]
MAHLNYNALVYGNISSSSSSSLQTSSFGPRRRQTSQPLPVGRFLAGFVDNARRSASTASAVQDDLDSSDEMGEDARQEVERDEEEGVGVAGTTSDPQSSPQSSATRHTQQSADPDTPSDTFSPSASNRLSGSSGLRALRDRKSSWISLRSARGRKSSVSGSNADGGGTGSGGVGGNGATRPPSMVVTSAQLAMMRYMAPSPGGSAHTSSSAASSPALSWSTDSPTFQPDESPYACETLSTEVYHPPASYFDPRAALPPSNHSAHPSDQQHQRPRVPPSQRDLRTRPSFHGQQKQPAHRFSTRQPPPRAHSISSPSPAHSSTHYQPHRPPPLRSSTTSSASYRLHLQSYSSADAYRPQEAVASPGSSSFSSISHPASSTAASSAFTSPPTSPGYHSQSNLNASTVSLGLAPSSFVPPPPLPKSSSSSASLPQAGQGDWSFSITVVSPSLLLTCTPSPEHSKESLYKDAQTGQTLYISREFTRSTDGRLLNSREVKGADGLVWPLWHDGMESVETEGESGTIEHLLLQYPSENSIRRAHLAGESVEPQKMGLVTEEVLYLRGGKKVAWKRFMKKSWFGNSDKEGVWKGLGGEKLRWTRVERKGAFEGEAVIKLVNEKTKEVMVAVHEVEGVPTKLIFSALILPSIQPVLLTLLHRSFATAAKKLRKDQREWEEEEGRSW